MPMPRIAATLLALALALSPALAQSPQSIKRGAPVAETLRQWGLIGAWSVDCSRPPGGGHIYIRYVVWMGGKVMTERDYADPQRNDSNEVTGATINQDGSVTLVVDFQSLGGQIRTFALMRDRPDRVRAVWNRGPDGVYSVKDGRFADGRETPWQYRCDDKRSAIHGGADARAEADVTICLTRGDAVDLIARFPALPRRAVVASGGKAAIGRPPRAVLSMLPT